MGYLFSRNDGFRFFEGKKAAAKAEIGSLSNVELESSDDSLKIILKAKHIMRLIELGNPYKIDKGEIEKEISSDPRFAAHWFREVGEGPVYKKGRQIEAHVPFSCDRDLFEIRPSTFTTIFPVADIRETELIFTFDFFSDVDTIEQVNKRIDEQIGLTKQYAGWLNNDVRRFNDSLSQIIGDGLSERREKLRRDGEFLQELDVQKEVVAARGFVKPEKIPVLKILKEDKEKAIEPSLELETYAEIIQMVNDLGVNLERSSERLRSLDEESLRDTILMALNSVYRGMASGEAFNKAGKTDILIKYLDKNIFIAECKIWRGDKYFDEGIAQLLSYLTWRDSKTSYIVFSKNQNIETVIEKSRALMKKHANYVALEREVSDSCFTYRFKQEVGATRECLITLHVFDLGS